MHTAPTGTIKNRGCQATAALSLQKVAAHREQVRTLQINATEYQCRTHIALIPEYCRGPKGLFIECKAEGLHYCSWLAACVHTERGET